MEERPFDYQSFAVAVLHARAERRWTQNTLAHAARVSVDTVLKLEGFADRRESANGRLWRASVIQLCGALDLDYRDYVRQEEES